MTKKKAEIVEDDQSDDGLDDLIRAELPVKKDSNPSDDEKSTEQPAANDDNEAAEDKKTESADDDLESDASQDGIDDSQKDNKEEDDKSDTAPDDSGDEKSEEITFKYRGKLYTLADLEADPKLRERIFTGANQQTHYQQKYEEQRQEFERQKHIVEELRQKQIQREQEEQQQQQQQAAPQLTPEQLKAAYGDQIKGMVEQGWLEDEFEKLYPNATSGILSMRDEYATRITQLENAIGMILQSSQQSNAQQAHQTVQQKLDNIFNTLASEGGIFEPLGNQETQQEFLTEIGQTLNPEIGSLIKDPGAIRELWIAKNHQKLVSEAEARYKAQIEAEKNKRNERSRQLAAGEGSGVRPGAASPTDPSPELLEAQDAWMNL